MAYLLEGASVALTEVAEVLGKPVEEVEAEARELFGSGGRDWAGRRALTPAEAAGLVSGEARSAADHSRRWLEHNLRLTEWEAERERTQRAAYQAAYDDSVRAGIGAPQAAHDAHGPARAAVESFESDHPKPVFEQASLPRRAAQRVKEAVAR